MAEYPEAAYWLARDRYRERYSLSSAEMDAEPYNELMINMEIRRLDGVKQKLDNRRMEQKSGDNG